MTNFISELVTEEHRRRKYMNTYCQAKMENGIRCNTPIPTTERVCEACKARLEKEVADVQPKR